MPHVIRRPGRVTGVRMAVLLALAHAVNDALTAVLGALLPTLQARPTASTTTLAVLVAAFSVSSSLTQPTLGRWPTGSDCPASPRPASRSPRCR